MANSSGSVLEFKDRMLECMDCGILFLFSSGEQAYFWDKELAEPKRCPSCRKARKDKLEASHKRSAQR